LFEISGIVFSTERKHRAGGAENAEYDGDEHATAGSYGRIGLLAHL
jgi:hypothetical protein